MILVIGAAGKTGRAVTKALVQRGLRVRAAVRPGSASRPVQDPLVTAVPVDLESGRGLAEALDGVEGVYHLAPNVHPDEVGIARRVARAAADAGVSRVAFHSVLHPDDPAMPHHLRKAEAERVVRSLHPAAVILRPAAYHQNLLRPALDGRIAVPYSLDTTFTHVDLGDVAEVAARVLTGDGHEGAAHDLPGPERHSVTDLARLAAAVLGHAVEAVQVPLREWENGPGADLPAQARTDLLAMFAAYDRDGFAEDGGDLARLLGRPPRTWSEALAAVAATGCADPR